MEFPVLTLGFLCLFLLNKFFLGTGVVSADSLGTKTGVAEKKGGSIRRRFCGR